MDVRHNALPMETERFQITVPSWTDKQLRLWAAVNGTNRARLVLQLINKGLNEEWEVVLQQIEQSAKLLNLTTEEFIEQILKENSE